MTAVHLQENDLDLLLDDETESETAPLRQHLAVCSDCLALYQRSIGLARALDRLPYHNPSPEFASRVMSRVRVFEPLHVTLLDAVRQLVPNGRRARLALGAGAAMAGTVLTSLIIWVAAAGDGFLFMAGLALERWRLGLTRAAQAASVDILGEPTAAVLGATGMRSIWLAVGILSSSMLVAALGLHYLVRQARRGRA